MYRVTRDRYSFFVGPDVEPVMAVPDGATVVFELSGPIFTRLALRHVGEVEQR